MNALLSRIYNFILLSVLGNDRVCACTCGRHQVYHVVPFDEAQSTMDSRVNFFLSDIMSPQEMDVIVGLLLGLCISWFLQWLDRVWHSGLKHWRENGMNYVGFRSWMPNFSNTRDLCRWLHRKSTEDSRGNMVHIKPDMYHNDSGSDT